MCVHHSLGGSLRKGCEYVFLGNVHLSNGKHKTLEGCRHCGRLLGGGTVKDAVSGLLRQDPEATIRPNGSKEWLPLDGWQP